MTNEKVLDALRVIDNAFSSFMVADMNGARFDLYEISDEELGDNPELLEEAVDAGKRMAWITCRVCDDVKALASALSTWSEHHHDNSDSGFDYELGDGTVVNSKRAFPALCELYQLDDNRPAVLDSFTNAVFYGIYDIAYPNAGKEA